MSSTSKKNYDYKLVAISITIVVIIAGAFFFFWDITKLVIRQILEAEFTNFALWTYTVVIFLIHYLRHKDKEMRSEPILTKKFGVFVDNALGGVAYATIITTSVTLLKGIYIQKFFDDTIYYKEFNDLDLTTVLGVASFLLYTATMKVVEISKETYKVQHTEKVLDENKKEVMIQE